MTKKIAAVILAAGVGSRMGADKTKQKIELLGKTLLKRTLEAFDKCDMISSITVVTRACELDFAKASCDEISKPCNIVVGGETRAESARYGFNAIPSCSDFVAIHDAARCLITENMIESVAKAALKYGAATASAKVYDTLKKRDEKGFIAKTEKRDEFLRAQTPQIFSCELYKKAIDFAENSTAEITDDNMMIEMLGEKIFCVDTGSDNIKITEKTDLLQAECILYARSGDVYEKESSFVDIRVGHGYDVHRFADGRELILGGVLIPYELGLLGHSDADVLIHAVMDALLGAAALGDIGKHFPDTAPEYKGISSMQLLASVKNLLDNAGYRVSNIDATVVMQKPKIAAYIDKMAENIALALCIEKNRVNIKATTEEKLGFTGSGDGAAAHAVALLLKK